MRPFLLALTLTLSATAHAQWQLQDAHTTADLRGIDNVGNGVAWASGTNGTVLRTEDAGFVWQLCAIPPGAEHLDFRAIQAFDNNTALVMSSGKGDLSRLYKTTDGCQTWTLLFTNPDKDGFWDALQMTDQNNGWLLGDPVDGYFVVGETNDGGHSFTFLNSPKGGRGTNESAPAEVSGRGAFAASNTALAHAPFPQRTSQKRVFDTPCTDAIIWFGTGGPGGSKTFQLYDRLPQCSDYGMRHWRAATVPISASTSSAGVFSLAAASDEVLVAIGGDYTKPNDTGSTAAYSEDGGQHWTAAKTPPHGYRSAVAYDPTHHLWITVGPNGTDISTDDGRNWHPLKPNPAAGDTPDADQHWNALSLPYVVGPHGRIATLRPNALPSPASKSH